MEQEWTMKVEKMGKIKEAEIRISPMMIFVGENNSGKSYLLTLLWGLLAKGKELFDYKTIAKSESYTECKAWLDSTMGEDTKIDAHMEQIFVNWFNDLLKNKKNILMKSLFNHTIDIGSISVFNYVRKAPLKIIWKEDAKKISCTKNVIKIPYNKEEQFNKEEKNKILNYICWNLLMNGIAAPLYSPAIKGGRTNGEPIFLPASRTGFMQTFKSLTVEAYSLFSSSEKVQTNLTQPVTSFIRDLALLKTAQKEHEVAKFINENILRGEAVIDEGLNTDYRYKPNGVKKELPMHVTSSLVSEVLPLVAFLNSTMKYKIMIIEEIEAHLHPQMQWLIAQAVVRLVNLGIPIWFTTHSDIVIQHINNMIKLSNNRDKESLMATHKYTKDDLIDPKQISLYQFSSDGNQSTIEKIESTEYGFRIPTFNKVLDELLNITYDLEEDL